MQKKINIPFGKIVIGIIAIVIVLSIAFSIKHEPIKKRQAITHQQKDYTSKTENAKCLKCHAVARYEIQDPDDSTKTICKRMSSGWMIDTNKYYNSNHWDFKCTDCHSDEYLKTPHDSKLKYVQLNICLDCHADDEKTAKYHFEDIDTAFRQSTHYKMDSTHFNCWSCHDPHYNKSITRDSLQDIRAIVAYDNAVCLKCHDTNTRDNYYEFFGKAKTNLYEKHAWLHELQNHFENVRCIDCHVAINDSLLVPHSIIPKASSVRECSACHAPNSILLKSLYKNRPQEAVNKFGFLNPVNLKFQNVIGMNRNYYLNLVALILLGIIGLFILTHVTIRIIKRK
jgi:hypothetical protein